MGILFEVFFYLFHKAMELLTIRTEEVNVLECEYEGIHNNLYVCKVARQNENDLRRLILENTELLRYLYTFKKHFGPVHMVKSLIKRCSKIALQAHADLVESNRVPQ